MVRHDSIIAMVAHGGFTIVVSHLDLCNEYVGMIKEYDHVEATGDNPEDVLEFLKNYINVNNTGSTRVTVRGLSL